MNNNPLKFTDPSGHGGLSSFLRSIGDFFTEHIGSIVSIALIATGWGIPLAALIGSAVNWAVNGGTFTSFAVGVGIGIAAGMVAGGVGDFFSPGLSAAIEAGKATLQQAALFGALAGAAGGAISSAVYGQNIEKGLAYGAATGAATAATRSYLEWWKSRMTASLKEHPALKFVNGIKEEMSKLKKQADIELTDDCMCVRGALAITEADIKAEGYGSSILNKFARPRFIEKLDGLVRGFYFTPDCEPIPSEKWRLLTIGPFNESFGQTVYLPVIDVYTGIDIIFGHVQYSPDIWHGNKTTVQVGGNGVFIIGFRKGTRQ